MFSTTDLVMLFIATESIILKCNYNEGKLYVCSKHIYPNDQMYNMAWSSDKTLNMEREYTLSSSSTNTNRVNIYCLIIMFLLHLFILDVLVVTYYSAQVMKWQKIILGFNQEQTWREILGNSKAGKLHSKESIDTSYFYHHHHHYHFFACSIYLKFIFLIAF